MKSFLFSVFLLLSFVLHAQKATLPDDVRKNIESRIELGKNPSIVIGIITADGPSYFSFGERSVGGAKANEHSIYEIGSITKTFTATLLADNIVRGEMSADDPVQKYLPDVKVPVYEDQVITLGHLADHTSSLPRMPGNFNPSNPANPYADYTVKQLNDFINGYTLTRPIGSAYEYSNLAVGLLGNIVATKSGMPYAELLAKKITGPLHMTETKITFDANMKKNLAKPYAGGTEVSNWDIPAMVGAGGIRSSVHDMLIYVGANMHLMHSELAQAMDLAHQPRHNKAGEASIGLNWFITPTNNGSIISHGGATGGYRAFAGFTSDNKMGVVVLTNSDQDVEDIGMHLLDASFPLAEVKPSIAGKIKEWIDKKGTTNLIDRYTDFKKEKGDLYQYDEMDINALGYWYMSQKNLPAAMAVFALNVYAFPQSSNVYDSYGEALMNDGQKKKQSKIIRSHWN